MNSSIKELLQREAQAVLNIPVTDGYEKAVQLIVEQVHEKGGKAGDKWNGKGRADCHEHSYDFLFYRYSGRVPASE